MSIIPDGKSVDFVGIGAPRCGTTWITECLREHPGVAIPSIKETYFFSRHQDKGIGWYRNLFTQLPPESLWGEFTVDYYLYPEIALDLLSLNQDMKILVCVRSPVETVYSFYNYSKTQFNLTENLLNMVNEKDSWLMEYGFYHKHLSTFLSHFKKENVHFVFLEDMTESPEKEMKNIYSFLGVDVTYVPKALYKEINCSKNFKYHFLFLQRLHMKRVQWRTLPYWPLIIRIAHFFRIDRFLQKLFSVNRKSEQSIKICKITPEEKKALQDLYSDDIRSFSKYCGRNFDHWLK